MHRRITTSLLIGCSKMMREPGLLGAGLAASFSVDDCRHLSEDPIANIPVLVPGVTVHLQDDAISGWCDVEGLYEEKTRSITVQRALSPRRTKFTTLHELGHDQARRDVDVARRLARAGDDAGRRLEEKIADAFAAEILIPTEVVDEVFGPGAPTARAVVELFQHDRTGGSREACCVRAAQRFGHNGYVVLAAGDQIRFCAAVGTAYRVRRGSQQRQDHLIVKAAERRYAVSDHVRLRHPSGSETPEFSGQAVADGDYVFAVLTDATSPPWGGWNPPRDRTDRAAVAPELDCPDCDTATEAWTRCEVQPSHRVCGECGCCECKKPKGKIAEKRCMNCFTTKRVDLFDDGSSVCRDCG